MCDDAGRPFINSKWVKASWAPAVLQREQKLDRLAPLWVGSPGLIRSDRNPATPNRACAWDCVAGHVYISTESGVQLCVVEGGVMAKRFGAGAAAGEN